LVQDGQNNNLNKLTFLERGYTGHENLQGIDLINMNARLYDAKLHRFVALIILFRMQAILKITTVMDMY